MAYKVCLDAGHYGDYYNQSPVLKTYYESNMTWTLHNYLADELKTWGIGVVKTRTSKAKDLELTARGRKAKGCDLFISVHSNAASSSSAKHVSVITMRSNSRETYDDKSIAFAKVIGPAVADVMGTTTNIYSREYVGDRDGNGYWDDEWYGVLQGAKLVKVPAIILEHGFHTNLAQAKWLSVDANLKKLAVAEAAAIASYFGIKTKPSGEAAPTPAPSSSKIVNCTGYATNFDKVVAGTYKINSPDGILELRNSANVAAKKLVSMKNGEKVTCYGYYSLFNKMKWYLVQYKSGNVTYVGFCYSGYLKSK